MTRTSKAWNQFGGDVFLSQIRELNGSKAEAQRNIMRPKARSQSHILDIFIHHEW